MLYATVGQVSSLVLTTDRQRTSTLIDLANQISIFDVLLDDFGLDLPREGRSFKSYCPFAYEHPDGGIEKQFRTYPTSNTAYCFAIHGFLTPTILYAAQHEISHRRAAQLLLERYGRLRNKDFRETWNDLVLERTKVHSADPTYAVHALQVYVRTIAPDRVTEDKLQAIITEQLDKLEATDPESLKTWYAEAKQTVTRAVS